MTDIVERLRRKGKQLERSDDGDLMYLVIGAADEIERLEHMKANLHGHIKRLEDENSRWTLKEGNARAEAALLRAENARLREALENIAIGGWNRSHISIEDFARATLSAGRERMIYYPECPNCQRYVEAAFQDAIEFSKFRTMLQIADDRMTSLVAENTKLREALHHYAWRDTGDPRIGGEIARAALQKDEGVTDIVERLRGFKPNVTTGVLCQEAADEIERLKEALTNIADQCAQYTSDEVVRNWVSREARAALREIKPGGSPPGMVRRPTEG